MDYYEFRAMNSDVVFAAEGNPQRIEAGFLEAQKFVEDSEQRLSRFLDDSELSRLNRAQGEAFYASPALFELVKLTRSYYDQTGGLFDPSILPDLKRAGYDRSMTEIRAHGANPKKPMTPRTKPSFEALRLEEPSRKIWLPPGMEIDLGGIAKGWIAERSARILAKYASACVVSAGGDLYSVGIPHGRRRWEIALEDPRHPNRTLITLQVGPGAVATSSITKRSWRQRGRRQHHLIDPRSGEPATTDWLSVTVIASQATTAEVFAKALLIAGADRALEINLKNDQIVFIAVDRQGKLWGSPESMEFIDVSS
jgi:thiamine biosynthesis lipoprotein